MGGSCRRVSADKGRLNFCRLVLPASGKTALVPCLLQQARNFLRAMRLDEEAFFYHSNCREPGIAGLMKVGHPG